MNRLRIILQFRYFCLIVLLIILVISFIRCNINYVSKYNISDNSFEGILLSKTIDGDKLSFIIKGKEKIKCIYYVETKEEKNFYDNLDLGVTLSIIGSLSVPSNNTIPNTFNYRSYLKYNHINYVLNVDKLEVINYQTSICFKIKNCLINKIKKYKSKEYLMMFILGDKTLLDSDEYSLYQDLSVSHIFAISGLHISIISGVLLKLLKKLNDNIKYLIVILFLLFYLKITGGASVVRSVVFFIMLYLNKRVDFNLKSIDVFYLTISLILLIDPFYLCSLGFIYSSVVTFSLIRFSKFINGGYILKSLKISFISTLFSLPVTINNNFEVNILGFLNNLFFVPFISFIIYPLCLLSLIFPFLDSLLYVLLRVMVFIGKHLFVVKVVIPKMNILFIVLYYVILYIFMNTYNKKLLFIIFGIIILNKYVYLFDNNFYVYYLDVGQGDSCLIKYKDKSMLIDTGGSISYEKDDWAVNKKYYKTDNTIKFMKSIGINKLSFLVLSHGDNDHMGEAYHLIQNFKVDKIILNCGDYNDLENELINNFDNYYSCINDIKFGKYNFKFLNTGIYDNENDNSSVMYLNVNSYKFLFMGDASTLRENDILNKYNLDNIDFLKAGHHGSDTSSGENFINNINPRYSIISVGKNNRYGHPKESVLNTLNKVSSNIYRTDIDGSIEIKINEKEYKIRNCSP